MEKKVRTGSASVKIDESGITALANAIVVQAAKDYRYAVKRLKKYPKNEKALDVKREVEHFFRSEWYGMLTAVDGEKLLHMLEKEAQE